MKPERERLICMLVGVYITKQPNASGFDLAVLIDQHLISHNESQMDKEDSNLLEELVSETMWLALTKYGIINRETRRSFGLTTSPQTSTEARL